MRRVLRAFGRWPALGPLIAGLLLGALALGPGVGRGYLLSYDMVFVPHPVFNAAVLGLAGGPPRAVPSDLVVAVLGLVMPADIVQKLILLGIFALACSGAAELLRAEHWLARLAAGVCYAWNPFVAERLIIGQWALLLGYSGLPWVLRALTTPAATRWRWAGRLVVALLPAAVGGFSAMCVSALVAVPVAWATALGWRERLRSVSVTLGALTLLSTLWLIPALTRAVITSPAGVTAFAARADTPFGSVGSLVLLGGIWNAEVVPARYGGVSSVIWLAVVLTAMTFFALIGWRRWRGLGIAAVAGLAIACVGLTGPGRSALDAAIAFWAGFAVLRDAQQFVAPLALADALGFGLGVAALMRLTWPARWKEGGAALGAILVVVPILLLPGLAWGAAGRLSPVWYPTDWVAARNLIDGDKAPGRVLLLPWASYRRFGWNAGEAVLDPWPRLLRREVIWNDSVQVGSISVSAEDPAARALDGLIKSRAPMTDALLADDFRFVIVDAGQTAQVGPGGGVGWADASSFRSRLPGCRLVLAGPGLLVYRLPADDQR